MSTSNKTVQRAINFTRSLADVINNLCLGCQDIITEVLAGTQPASINADENTRFHKTTGNGDAKS